MIANFAERLCNTVPTEGRDGRLELSGKAKAELNALIKKIANIGVEGAAKYQQSQYKGVLQKDLAAVLKENTNCKLQVLKELKETLLGPGPNGDKRNRTMSEADTAPGGTYESVPQRPSRLSGAQVSQITGIRLPGRPVPLGHDTQADMTETFRLIAVQQGRTVDRTESFHWPHLDETEARRIRDTVLHHLQQAGYIYQQYMRPPNQSSYAQSEVFVLRRREQYVAGLWAVQAYGSENNLRYLVYWSSVLSHMKDTVKVEVAEDF
jgi:hypothetical protein